MISAAFAQTMARYNRWQNESLYSAASGLTDAERRLDRGAFFGSIHGTLGHLLWGDTMWMSRFDGWPKPVATIAASADWIETWDDLTARRTKADASILTWANVLTDTAIAGTLRWYSGAVAREVEKPLGLLITHFFNHQTHHRGQVHAMLTAAGARAGDTDLFVMPDAT